MLGFKSRKLFLEVILKLIFIFKNINFCKDFGVLILIILVVYSLRILLIFKGKVLVLKFEEFKYFFCVVFKLCNVVLVLLNLGECVRL